MELNKAIHNRRSIRGYKSDPVPRDVLEKIMETSQWAGSPGNMQPWEFAVIGGNVMEEFKKRLNEKMELSFPSGLPPSGPPPPSGLPFPSTMEAPEFYKDRRTKYYRENFDNYVFPPGTENIEEKKRAHFLRGNDFYGAPNIIIIYTHKAFLPMPWGIMSIGIVAQTFCLAAMDHGLGTCIMGRPVDWPDILKDLLGVSDDKVFICGIIAGYPETENKVNNVPRIRLPIDEWVHWHGL